MSRLESKYVDASGVGGFPGLYQRPKVSSRGCKTFSIQADSQGPLNHPREISITDDAYDVVALTFNPKTKRTSSVILEAKDSSSVDPELGETLWIGYGSQPGYGECLLVRTPTQAGRLEENRRTH